jgi:nucleoside-diphosphate-sugar epimerase
MKVLYIGGTGEISYECVRQSADLGHEVSVFNRGRRDEPLPKGVRQITGDVADDAAYGRLAAEGFDAVCQFLAYRRETVERDVRVFGGRCGQYVFISSASAYQKPPPAVVVTEETPLANPYWPYSRAKIDMERSLREQDAAGAIGVTIVRPSHTHRTRFPGGIARGDDWAWRMLNRRPVIVHGDGQGLLTITHSRDLAAAFCRLLGQPRAVGQAFHITRHMESYAWDDIYRAMGAALGVEPRLAHVPVGRLLDWNGRWAGPLLGDKAWPVRFDNTKVKSVVAGWRCEVSLAEAMAGAAADYFARRAEAYRPDDALHERLDRIAAENS